MDDPQRNRGRDDPDGRAAVNSPWEWVSGAIGLLLVAATLVFLLADAMRNTRSPPDPAASVVGIEAQASRFLVRVRVDNRGALPAGSLRITGVLKEGERVIEEAETEFQYLPAGSSREAGLFFTSDPRRLRLEVRARSYQQP